MAARGKKRLPLEGKRILVSNDDGIHAPGLKILEDIAAKLSDDIWVVAPENEQSGAGHSLTLTQPMRIRKIGEQRYMVKGTPTDCVLLACKHLITDKMPDLLLSGVNRGANLGEDLMYSGTVAAAMEGTLLGIPSIAFSQVITNRERKLTWTMPKHFAAGLIMKLWRADWPRGVMYNINFPDLRPRQVAGIEITTQGRRDAGSITIDERIDPRGIRYQWYGYRGTRPKPGGGASDLSTVSGSAISITPIHHDLTHHRTRTALRKAFGLTPGK